MIIDVSDFSPLVSSEVTGTQVYGWNSRGLATVCNDFLRHLRDSEHPSKDLQAGVISDVEDEFLNLDKTGLLRKRYKRRFHRSDLPPLDHPEILEAFFGLRLNNITTLVLPTRSRASGSSLNQPYLTLAFINSMTQKTAAGTEWGQLFPDLKWIAMDDRVATGTKQDSSSQSSVTFKTLFNMAVAMSDGKSGCGTAVHDGEYRRFSQELKDLVVPRRLVWSSNTIVEPEWQWARLDGPIEHTFIIDLTTHASKDTSDNKLHTAAVILGQFEDLCVSQARAMKMSSAEQESSTHFHFSVDQSNEEAKPLLEALKPYLVSTVEHRNFENTDGTFSVSVGGHPEAYAGYDVSDRPVTNIVTGRGLSAMKVKMKGLFSYK